MHNIVAAGTRERLSIIGSFLHLNTQMVVSIISLRTKITCEIWRRYRRLQQFCSAEKGYGHQSTTSVAPPALAGSGGMFFWRDVLSVAGRLGGMFFRLGVTPNIAKVLCMML